MITEINQPDRDFIVREGDWVESDDPARES